MDIDQLQRETAHTLSRNKKLLATLFTLELLVLLLFCVFAPTLSEAQKSMFLQIPRSPQDFLALISAIKAYTDSSYVYLTSAFCFFFVFLQSFGIPGPLILSIISGALFGKWVALALVTLCSTVGSLMCYQLSEMLGKGLIVRYFPQQIVEVNQRVERNRQNIFFYLLFLRFAPVVPNWLINLCSPVIGVSKMPFMLATLIGLIPANFLFINSGITLSSLQGVGLDIGQMSFLLCLGALALIPTLIASKYKSQ